MSSTLHDGEHDVRSIGVFLYMRNNEQYLVNHLIPLLNAVEQKHKDIQFHYYVMENDSTDDTKRILSEFMQDRNGVFICENLQLNNLTDGTTFARVQRIAYIRNYLLNRVRDKLKNHDWCWFIDSNLHFEPEWLSNMFAHKPASDNIGMLGCTSLELQKNDGKMKDVPVDVPFVTMHHYYDTYALVNSDDILTYPACLFPECVRPECVGYREKNPGSTWNVNDKVIDMRCVWGGLVLIRSDILQNESVSWKPLGIMHENSLCEHIYFCDVVKAISKKRICIITDVFAYWLK